MGEVAHYLTQSASSPAYPLTTVKGDVMNPGEMCERVNMSDWEGTHNVGDSIFGSSAWPEVSTMLTWTEVPGVYAVPEKGVLCVSDHVNAALDKDCLVISNPTVYPARVKVMIERPDDMRAPLGLYWQEKMQLVSVEPGCTVSVRF